MAGTVKTNQLPVINDITGAQIVGLDKDGNDARFPLANILRPENGIALPTTNPNASGTRFAGETWIISTANLDQAFPYFLDLNNQAITPTKKVGEKYTSFNIFVWNNGAWTWQKTLVDSPDLTNYYDKSQVDQTFLKQQNFKSALQVVVDDVPLQATLMFGTLLAGNTAGPTISSTSVFLNSNSLVTEKVIVNRVIYEAAEAGNVMLVVGSLVGTIFTLRTAVPAIPVSLGANDISLTNGVIVNAGEYVGIGSGSAKFRYKSSGLPGNHYTEAKMSNGGANAGDGSYIAFGFYGLTQRSNPTDVFLRAGSQQLTNAVGPAVATALEAPSVTIDETLGYAYTDGSIGSFSNSSRFVYNELSVFVRDEYVKTVDIGIAGVGEKYLAIGTPTLNGFKIRKRLGPYNFNATGVQSAYIGESVLKGETIAINGGSASIRFKTAASVSPNNRWVEASTTVNTYAGLNSSISLKINASYQYQPLGNIVTDENIAKKLLEYADLEYTEPGETINPFTAQDSWLTIESNKYYGVKGPALKDGYLKQIAITVDVAGSITFAIATIDQNSFVVEDRTFTRPVVAGSNTISVSEKLLAGQSILIKAAVTSRVGIRADINYEYLVSSNASYGSIMVAVDDYQLNLSYVYTVITPKPFVRIEVYNALSARLTALESTVQSLIPLREYDDLVGIGNSLMQHIINETIGWWGLWGMAATREEFDLIHMLQKRLKVTSPNINLYIKRANDFEGAITAGEDFNFAQNWTSVLGDTTKRKAILIRLGDNIQSNFSAIPERLGAAIQFLKTTCPNPGNRIVVTGNWYAHEEKDNYMKQACDAQGVTFVKISQLATTENKNAVGNQVYGADGQLHTIFNSGVASHPDDSGHAGIADLCYPYFKY